MCLQAAMRGLCQPAIEAGSDQGVFDLWRRFHSIAVRPCVCPRSGRQELHVTGGEGEADGAVDGRGVGQVAGQAIHQQGV